MALRRVASALTLALAIGSVFIHAQTPGQNINMVSGKTLPGGDPYLQKQNEPSGAVSTENPCRLIAGANDYRAVNLPGLPADKENGDAWVGWYTSINCGQTWYSTLVPGFLQDTSAAGKASPVYGLTTAADPTVRAGAGGFFAYSFIAFNRGTNVGKLAVARFLDKNTREAVTKPETAITYIDTKAWDTGSAGQYIDKPTVTISQGTGTCTLAGRTIPASTVHVAWTVFVGNNDQTIRTKIYYARSSNCGTTLDGPATKLSEGYAVNQSANIAVAPNGAIYVVWRQFKTAKGDLDQILIAKSIDGGKSFTKGSPVPLTPFLPMDQGTTSKTFRTNAFPTIATDQYGRLYVALAVRGFASDQTQARVVVSSTLDGIVWTMPQAIENGASAVPGHQIMPAMTSVGGKLNVVWLDFRDDASGVYEQFIKEIYPIRHTMDVRGAQAVLKPDGSLAWTTYGILQEELPAATAPRISKYLVGDYQDPNGDSHLRQLNFNRSNLKLYAGGTRPFIGDFIDAAGLAYLTQQAGPVTTWIPNNGLDPLAFTTAAQTLYAFWTDNRDAKVSKFPFEPAGEEQEGGGLPYTAPGTTACSAWGGSPEFPSNAPPTKTRNANVYMSRITPGLFVAAPANTKPSLNASGRVQRAFPVLVQNRTTDSRRFRIIVANQPPDFGTTGVASLRQVPETPALPSPLPAPVLTADVIVPPNSTVTRTVYVVSSVKYPRIKVDVIEQGVAPGALPLTGSTILNLDSQNADVENADVENADVENLDVANKELHNADVENADVENADVENADVENADVENADVENADVENADVENADVENADVENADVENADVENAALVDGSVTDYSVEFENHGNTTTGYQVKFAVNGDTSPFLFQLIGRRVYKTPTAVGCELKEAGQNQILFNVNLTAADLAAGTPPDPLDPSATNTTLLLVPGEHIRVTLRAWDKDVLTNPGAPPNDGIQPFCPMLSPDCPVVTHMVTTIVRSESANTGQTTPPSDTFTSTPTEVPFTLIVTNTNDSGPGSLRQAILNSNSHSGFRDTISFKIPGTGVHTITPASPLPQLTDPVDVDGTTQAGYAGSPVIELNGASAGGSGLSLAASAGSFVGGCPPPPPPGGEGGGPAPCDPVLEPGTTIRGLAINRFAGNGILIRGNGNTIVANYVGTDPTGTLDRGNGGNGIQIIDGANNTIGGGPAENRNIVSGNGGEGIRLDGSLATGNMIRGNYVGTTADGMGDLGNSASGIYIRKAPGNSIIGNLVSGNDGFAGIALCGDDDASDTPCGGGPSPGTNTSDGAGSIVQGNLIGTDALGTGALGNTSIGLSLDATPNTLVGGPLAGDRNVISATKSGPGVVIFNPGAENNLIRGNYIGTDITGAAPLANHGDGIAIRSGADNNIISGKEEDSTAPNTIKFNTGMGIDVQSGQHEFRVNRIDANGDLGINGGEIISNGPYLTRATVNGGVVTVAGSFFGAPAAPYTIDLYVSDACDPSGYGEGAQWFGGFVANGAIEGSSSFNVGFSGNPVAAGQIVTALITTGDQITNPETIGETSQFSNCQMAVPPGFKFSAPSDGGNGHVYEYVESPGAWTAARTAAAARTFRGVNGHLVTITSGFENSLVGSFRGATGDLRGWIGLTDEVTEGAFRWITGEPVSYTAWNQGEPSSGVPPGQSDEDYVEIFAAAVWNDISNSGDGFNQGYVVEYEVNPFAPTDLIVSSLMHSPASPTTTDVITFTAVVKNVGTATAPESTLMFKTGGETPGMASTLFAVPALAPGETFTVQRQATLIAQNYINTATADYFDAVAETNETNNTTTDSYTVTGGGPGDH